MTARLLGTCLAVACACVPARAGEDAPQPSPRSPFYQLREHQAEYAGPGRNEPPPRNIDEVLLGYFGPSDPAHPDGGDLWLAARMAVDEANRRGGYRGKPFRIVARWSENPWGTGVAEVVRMVYDEKVWAIVGGIDGPSTHLAEQVVAKARLPLVSPVSTDKTSNLANVPWMFSLVPGDHLLAPVLASAISERIQGEKGTQLFCAKHPSGRSGKRAASPFPPLVLVSGVDHDSALFARELRKCLAARRAVLSYHFQCRGTEEETAQAVRQAVESKPAAVALVAGAQPSARLVIALGEQGFKGPVFGGPAMGRRRFREEAGNAAEGMLFPLLFCVPRVPQGDSSEGFFDAFEQRHGHAPDYAAAHTYDAFRLVIAAVRAAGLNRAQIRDAIEALSPYSGVTGTIRWDPLGSNTRPVPLGTIREGRVIPASS